MWRGKDRWRLVAGRDGDFYLADGIHNVVVHLRARDFAPVNFTYAGTRKLTEPRNYIGEIDQAGDDKDHFNGPDGIALDGDGNILVLDGDVVKVYAADGRFVTSQARARGACPDPRRRPELGGDPEDGEGQAELQRGARGSVRRREQEGSLGLPPLREGRLGRTPVS